MTMPISHLFTRVSYSPLLHLSLKVNSFDWDFLTTRHAKRSSCSSSSSAGSKVRCAHTHRMKKGDTKYFSNLHLRISTFESPSSNLHLRISIFESPPSNLPPTRISHDVGMSSSSSHLVTFTHPIMQQCHLHDVGMIIALPRPLCLPRPLSLLVASTCSCVFVVCSCTGNATVQCS